MTSGLVDVFSACLELCEASKLSSADVRNSILKECSLCTFVCNAVRRDLAHNLPDCGLGSLLVCFASLVDNCQVSEDHEVRVDNWFDP